MVKAECEMVQPAGEGEAWNDSMYFNFFSKDGSVAGISRIGLLPNRGRCNAGLVALSNGVPFAGSVTIDSELPAAGWDDIEIEGLRYRVERPLERCSIELESPSGKAELVFEGLAPPFDYADCPVRLPEQVASGHYEQHCRVSGWVEGQGRRHQVEGFGQRDHSWGERNWAGVKSWRWLQAIFDEGLAFNAFQVESLEGKKTASGYLHRDGKSRPLAMAEIETEYDRGGSGQRTVRLHLEDSDGRRFQVTGQRFALLPLTVEGARVNEGLFRWQLEGRTGYGVYEHLFQG